MNMNWFEFDLNSYNANVKVVNARVLRNKRWNDSIDSCFDECQLYLEF